MKRASLLILPVCLLSGCDYMSQYSFKVKNDLENSMVRIEFSERWKSYIPEEEQVTWIIRPGEEVLIKIIDGSLNSPSHDCLRTHGGEYMRIPAFETYADDVKLDKDLHLAEHWTYRKKSKWDGEYTLVITEEMAPE